MESKHFITDTCLVVVDGSGGTVQTRGSGPRFTMHIAALDWLAASLYGMGPQSYLITWLEVGGVVKAGSGPQGPRISMTLSVASFIPRVENLQQWIQDRLPCTKDQAIEMALGLSLFFEKVRDENEKC